MNHTLTNIQVRALKYVKNARESISVLEFDEDHAPVGPQLREGLVPSYMAPDAQGYLKLTDEGRKILEEFEKRRIKG